MIVVGGIHDMDDIERMILEEGFEYVSMSRPLVLEPGLIGKYRDGKSRTAKCIECNYCTMGLYSRPLRCYYGKVPKE